MITPQIAVRGTASNKPIAPNKLPKTNNPKINQTGWRPIFSPSSFGVKKFDSIICPKINIVAIMAIELGSKPHWKRAITIAQVTPKIIPAYGIKENNPVNKPIKNP